MSLDCSNIILYLIFFQKLYLSTKAAQQSVHLTLGILRHFQAVFYALVFFWLDGFAVPAPAQVTQTVETTCFSFLLNTGALVKCGSLPLPAIGFSLQSFFLRSLALLHFSVC